MVSRKLLCRTPRLYITAGMLNILWTFLQRYINSSADLLGHFIWKTRSSYPFIYSVLQLVESAPFIFLKLEKSTLLGGRLPVKAIMGRTPPPPPPPTVDPESSSLLGVFTNFVTNSSKIEGKWIVSSKGKIPKTFCHKMALRTDQNPWVILLLLHQTFAPKECIKRLDSVKKNYKHLLFKASFCLWERNNDKFFIIPKLNTFWKSEIWNTLKINDE